MAEAPQTVELPLTLHISEQTRQKLTQRAAVSGADLNQYVSAIVERSTSGRFSLEELSGSVFQRFLESGTTDDELGDELEVAKHELRAQRRRQGL